MANLAYVPTSTLQALLKSADPKSTMYVRILTANRLALGTDPLTPSTVIDFSKEKVLPYGQDESSRAAAQPATAPGANVIEVPAWRPSRRGGEYWFEMDGRRVECRSLKELLSAGLLALESAQPGTIEKLSHIKPRSRRIVARDPKQLFDKDHLAKDYAEKLTEGWFFGTNNSANETNAWLQRACECAGVTCGEQFKTSISEDHLRAL
jgi:hypothetical protein